MVFCEHGQKAWDEGKLFARRTICSVATTQTFFFENLSQFGLVFTQTQEYI